MTITKPTNMNRQTEFEEPESARQQEQPDQADRSAPETRRNQAGSSDQRPTLGRKPLFGR